MKFIKYLPILLISAILLSCKSHSLLPQTQNVPLFIDKNQAQLDATFSYRTAELQAAYTPINHVGIIVNGMLGLGSMNSLEAGLGAYGVIQKKCVLELYGGYGMGSVQSKDSVIGSAFIRGDRYYDINYQGIKYFIQPNIGIRFTDNVSLAISCKTNFWTMTKYSYFYERYGSFSGNLKYQDSIYSRNKQQITFEPAITLKAGGKNVKFMMQVGAYALNDVSRVRGRVNPYNDNPFFLRLGINASFGGAKKE